ncbi:helix-turn-helix transcriptional regulator [Kibdelosporangium persicum]|uniref:Transcriptional regulator n=1 Tax=Kibdelosporangium persicum TaxID=2698649 RepID=A0ABX2FE71_9PSEU|nr:helix-turn-helix transcriptional regulator [Kibdelosporangium persicum]NRN69185.1 Transcriptional regulator [Kibdelosporangium persicum]
MSPTPCRPSFKRRKLGAKLREMRKRSGLNLDDAALRLDKTRSALHRIETGEGKPDVHVVRSMMDLYEHYSPALLDEVRDALKPPWYEKYGVKNRYHVDVETEAATVWDFSTLIVPELLRTTQYTLALLNCRNHPAPQNEATVQQVRQNRLTDSNRPLKLIAVIDELVLHRTVGGPETMHNQLRHLVEAAALPTVALHVLPRSKQVHWAAAGALTLLTLPDSDGPELLHVDHLTGPLDIDDQGKVREAHNVLEHLRNRALSQRESITLIERMVVEQRYTDEGEECESQTAISLC